MPQNKNYKDRLILVNVGAIGPKKRQSSANTSFTSPDPAGFHPMARNSWGMDDRIRAVLGKYYTVYQSSKGSTLVSYASIGSKLLAGTHGAGGHWDRASDTGAGIGRLKLQLNNMVLSFSPLDSGLKTDMLFNLKGSNANWNAYTDKRADAENWLSNKTNFQNYIYGTSGMPSAWLQGLLWPNVLSASVTTNTGIANAMKIEDHTCTIYVSSADKKLREISGWLVDVKSQYNFYTRRYEQATAAPSVVPSALPNAYIMQSELRNTGSALLATSHLSALSLGGAVEYFVSDPSGQGSVTESTIGQTYDKWAAALETVDGATDVNPNNADFVILHSDEAITNEDYIENFMIPFCTKIIIPPDADAITGINSKTSFLRELANNKRTKGFIDVLQVAAINSYINASPGGGMTQRMPGSFTITRRSPSIAFSTVGVFHDYSLTTTTVADITLCNVQSALLHYEMIEEAVPQYLDGTSLGLAQKLINGYGYHRVTGLTGMASGGIIVNPPYRFLKDYRRVAFNPMKKMHLNTDSILDAQSELEEVLEEYYTRTYAQILDGTSCHTETLMYVVKKYEVDTLGVRGTVPIQTFYISNKFAYENLGSNESIPIVYYDSQVKYEQKYQYTFEKIIVVVGNEYYYSDAAPPGSSWWNVNRDNGMRSIKVTNKPNLKVMIVPMGATPVNCMVIDKPPVSPDMSFYIYKGINHKLNILLAASSGRYSLKPIAITNSDPEFFEKEYLAQTGVSLSFDQIVLFAKKIEFRSDDPVDAYQLFRLTTPPTSYASFSNAMISIDPQFGTPGSYVDTIAPNVKHYYCVRAVDIHGNISNPGPIMEIELVDNEGKIYLKQKPFVFKTIKQGLIKSGRRFILIEPSEQQQDYDAGSEPSNAAIDSAPTLTLGAASVEDRVWEKVFKVRISSKQTGRKIDLNISFKNPGIVKGRE